MASAPRACQPGAGATPPPAAAPRFAFGDAHRFQQHGGAGARARRLLGNVAAKGPGARPAVVEAQDVPGDIVEPAARAQVPLGVGDQGLDNPPARGQSAARRRTAAVGLRQQIGVLVGGAAERDAVHVPQMRLGRIERGDAAVDDDLQLGMRGLEPIHAAIVERRDLAVLLGRQALQPGLARMHDEGPAACRRDGRDEALEVRLAVLLVDADAALDRHRHRHARRASPPRSAPPARARAIRQAPKRPSCTRSDGQPTLRLISS